ncbi:hypothetical protein B5P21_01695 [Clavibacter michiganensis subsp. insidiosus]|nr:hypothetical protein B5P21_01695 [Clavibacter michiganensis subsp. insidiosus]
MTFTAMVLPLSAAVSAKVAAVAPATAMPLRVHWYAKATGAGLQDPGLAVSTLPTDAVPLRTGTAPVRVGTATRIVDAEVFVVGAYPVLLPVTETLSCVPTSATVTA